MTIVTAFRDDPDDEAQNWHIRATTICRSEGLSCRWAATRSEHIPMEKQQAISYLRHGFPELAEPGKTRVEEISGAVSDVHQFAYLIGDLLAHEDMRRVQHAFDLMEDFLRAGGAELRNWVCSYLDALQDIASWNPSGSDVFLRFLGSETRRAWSALEAIRKDLDHYSTLEAEVLMWRISHSRADRPVSRRVA